MIVDKLEYPEDVDLYDAVLLTGSGACLYSSVILGVRPSGHHSGIGVRGYTMDKPACRLHKVYRGREAEDSPHRSVDPAVAFGIQDI